MTSNCGSPATVLEAGTMSLMAQWYESQRKRNSAGRETSSGDCLRSSEKNLLLCEIARLAKELQAVRAHMDWQAQHIHNLEMRLLERS